MLVHLINLQYCQTLWVIFLQSSCLTAFHLSKHWSHSQLRSETSQNISNSNCWHLNDTFHALIVFCRLTEMASWQNRRFTEKRPRANIEVTTLKMYIFFLLLSLLSRCLEVGQSPRGSPGSSSSLSTSSTTSRRRPGVSVIQRLLPSLTLRQKYLSLEII